MYTTSTSHKIIGNFWSEISGNRVILKCSRTIRVRKRLIKVRKRIFRVRWVF